MSVNHNSRHILVKSLTTIREEYYMYMKTSYVFVHVCQICSVLWR